jgi:hypothetical protein
VFDNHLMTIDCGLLPEGVTLAAPVPRTIASGAWGGSVSDVLPPEAVASLPLERENARLFLLKSERNDLIAAVAGPAAVYANITVVHSGTCDFSVPAGFPGWCRLRWDVPGDIAPDGVIPILDGQYDQLEWFRQLAKKVGPLIPGGIKECDYGLDTRF